MAASGQRTLSSRLRMMISPFLFCVAFCTGCIVACFRGGWQGREQGVYVKDISGYSGIYYKYCLVGMRMSACGLKNSYSQERGGQVVVSSDVGEEVDAWKTTPRLICCCCAL